MEKNKPWKRTSEEVERDNYKLAAQYSLDLSKQLVTFAIAIVGFLPLSIGQLSKFGDVSEDFGYAAVLMLMSVVCGVLNLMYVETQMAILLKDKKELKETERYLSRKRRTYKFVKRSRRVLSIAQVLGFLLGLIYLVSGVSTVAFAEDKKSAVSEAKKTDPSKTDATTPLSTSVSDGCPPFLASDSDG